MPKGGKYVALTRYLEKCDKAVVKMKFKKIESILGDKLDKSAYKYPEFWTVAEPHSIAFGWLNAGYRIKKVNIKKQKLEFVKNNFDKEQALIDELFEKDCYVIDFLPVVVPPGDKGQFFEVEHLFLNGDRYIDMQRKFANIILKLMCYYSVTISWFGGLYKPEPKLIDQIIKEIMDNHSGWLNCLFEEENFLINFEWDCAYLAVFNPHDEAKSILQSLAKSEGLFWRKSEN
ncbi:DUF7662 domain-containing protein [Criibacterium bergeronii]|uniref:DUF7662 domain-containing protein n=1 Tax=Criibacterium bergeronii TaxID=1871336 RepID=A0A371IJ06_9FIRM|nr:hypothetical protein [Criibacterium bergeronii]RDY20458.1 hypothetical protein BBG48_009905 [Criibacterium bergeronii]TRW26048.1 hypothetical protein FL857_06415 [Criibacterium bergeronii]